MNGEKSLSGTMPRWRNSPVVHVAFLLAVTLITRLYRLTHWPLFGDEFFTIHDSQVLANKGKPLLFYLNHFLIEPTIGLDVLGVRLLPVLFGIASVPLLYWAGRRLVGTPVGLFAALLAVFNPWNLYLSQFARYYPLVFFFSAIVLVAFFVAFREESVGWLAAGVVAGILAILAHASAGLVLGAIGFWIVASTAWRYASRGQVSRFRAVVSSIIVAVVIVASAVYLVPVLVDWIRNIPAAYGFAGPVLVMSFGQWLTAGTSLFAAAGAVWMWQDDRREMTTFLVSVLALPILFLSVAGYFLKASVPFLYPAAPAVFLLAGYFLHRLHRAVRSTRLPAVAVSGTVLLAGIASGIPSFVSHYMDGSRPDFRSAAEYLNQNIASGDAVILTDMKNSLTRHLDLEVRVQGFRRTVEQLEEDVGEATRKDSAAAVWVTPWIRDRGGFNERGLGPATNWIRRHCVLRRIVSRPRLDFRRNEVHVYRCDGRAK